MADNKLVITETGFLTEFLNQHTQRTDRPFCFILGAGASRSSGIPTGGEMAQVWLRELHEAENFEGLALDEWAPAERLGIDGFKVGDAANFYPQLYQRRYGDHEQAGYAFLESQMEEKEPSYGYSVLAYLLTETPHRVVITTNFDNLVADGLSIHASRFPLVIGHDALAQYATVELRRPLVAKIHGALGFSPKNQPKEVSRLPEGWQTALARILDRYTPIVVGYAGNDGSLMGFLQDLPAHIPDRVFWCVRLSGANATDLLNQVSPAVREYVQSRRGRFVPIRGFDELMAKLLTKLSEKGSVPDLYRRLQDRHREREKNYDDQQRRLFEAAVPLAPSREEDKATKPRSSKADPTLTEAVSEIAESRKDKPWWVWAGEALAAPDSETEERIYVEALSALEESHNLHRRYAGFLERKGDLENAEAHYRRALEINSTDPINLSFYGDFLDRFRNVPDMARDYFQRAYEAKPDDDYVLSRYASFLGAHGDTKRAEELFERALSLYPEDDYILRSYASFLRNVKKDVSRAEELERRLLNLSTKN